jgi:superfamily II DNA helicase RecQ
MRVKLFTFRYSATLGGFDDSVHSDYVRDKEVIAFREHFYSVNEVPHVTCVLIHQDAVVPREMIEAAREIPRREERPRPTSNHFERRKDRPDVTAGLSEPERLLFNTLRTWRSKKAHDEGVAPFIVFTNRELLEIVRKRPASPTALGNLDGIGPGKVKRHATEVLRILHGARPEPEPAVPAQPASPEPTVAEASR